jgi:uncharacterized protein YkwD
VFNLGVGVADRDYTRPRPPRRSSYRFVALIVGASIAFLLVSGLAKRAVDWIRTEPASSGVRLAPGLEASADKPPRDDPWKAFLAPENICPGRKDSSAPPVIQQQVAICLLNYARQRQGLPGLPELPQLSQWSTAKAADIVRCNNFAHAPCGQAADRYARAAGFTGPFGENIFLGPQIYKTPLAAVDGWLNSDDHRANLFRPEWRYQGIALLHTDTLGGQDDVAVWVSGFLA